ncbi:MAG TPA: sensor histidine kinase, partial [Ruminococcaceae bacterium]|nr:sensor histidine kinase [Oscillospiraceae bacterium]
TIPPEQHEHYLKIVLAEAQRLSRLVRAMLDIAKIEAGELKLSPTVFDINETVCRALFPFERKIEEKRLEIRGLDVPEKVLVFADADLIHQVVYNLIDNAIKFSDDGGYIEFRYATVRNQVYVSVRNSGQGITEEECAHIFERFYKTDKSRSRDKQGVGLGLHIVKSVINFHGGDITVHSVPGKYTEFTFTLPTPPKKNAYK